MSIYLQGKEANLAGVYQGDEDIIEIWQGDEKIWPDETGVSGYLLIEAPDKGNEDYAYWKHALSDVEDGEINNAKHLMFEVEGQQ